MRIIRNIFFLYLFSLPFFAFPQKAKFDFFTTSDGLSGNLTSYITQDEQGYIWFLNEFKLHRFDGHNTLIYPPELLPHSINHFSHLNTYQDSLLLLVNPPDAYLLNPKTGDWQSFQIDDSTQRFWGLQIINDKNVVLFKHIYQEEEEFGYSFSWLNDNNYQKIFDSPPSSEDFCYHVHSDYLGTQFYLFKKRNNQHWIQIQDTLGQQIAKIPLDGMSNSQFFIFHSELDANDNLIFLAYGTTGRYFYVFNPNTLTVTPHPINRFLKTYHYISHFALEENGSIWVSGQDKTLYYYNALKDTLLDYRNKVNELIPNNNNFIQVYNDKAATTWVSSQLGLLKINSQKLPFQTFFTGKSKSGEQYSFRGITEDATGNIYASCYPQKIVQIGVNTRKESIPYTDVNLPFGLLADDNNIWLNNGQVLNTSIGVIQSISGIQFNDKSDTGLLAKDKNGTIWCLINSHIYQLKKSAESNIWQEAFQLPNANLHGIDVFYYGEQSGKFWLNFKDQLMSYAHETKTLTSYSPEDLQLPIGRYLAIEEDKTGQLWLGTDIGLVHFNPTTKAVQHYAEQDGLSNNFICGILPEGDSCLWLSTNRGLSRFHKKHKTFLNFFEEDGIAHNEFNRVSYFKASDGRMYFGGLSGITAFYPKEVMQSYQRKNQTARMVLSSFERIDEKQDTLIRQYQFANQPVIHLYHWDKSFTFEYTLTDYNNPQKIQYSYQMEGYENVWSSPSEFNFVRYSSLPTGQYTFRVKARDSQGIWHPNQLTATINIHPPWWETCWAYLVYSLLFIGLVYLIFSFLKRRWQLQNQLKLEHAEAQRLKELDSFKSQLFTNLTHEFRTPLTVILGMADQIKNDPAKDLQIKTNLIERNGQNLLRLINQLLDLSKLENKSFQLHLQQDNIIPYLRYVTESFQTFANSKNLALRFYVYQESIIMDFDPEQIKQVLTNLISNAVKFTPSGGEVSVLLTQEKKELIITVKDTGIGISDQALPHIFDRFYQADSTTTRQVQGTGIGLAHTQELVKLMDGSISVSSKLEKGTAFTVKLPIQQQATKVTTLETTEKLPDWMPEVSNIAVPTLANTSSNLQKDIPQVLIIEDNPDVVIYLKSCLQPLYQIDVAYNGKIGIEKAVENIPDLIISDIMMPEKNGYEVCDFVKNDERTSHIPVILLTAKADVASKLVGLSRGADAYLAKPFNKEELLIRIKTLLEKQHKMAAYFINKLQLSTPAHSPAINITEASEDLQIEDVFIQKVRKIVAENYSDEHFALPVLCQKIRMSRSQLFRKMKALIHQSPSEFIKTYRLTQGKILLETTDLTVNEVAWKVGFKEASYFSRTFQEQFGVTPSEVGS